MKFDHKNPILIRPGFGFIGLPFKNETIKGCLKNETIKARLVFRR
jgi:hypothetical protein